MIFLIAFKILDMQKNVNYIVVVAMIILAALMSCDKDNNRPNDDECICIYVNMYGEYVGGDAISEEILEALNFRMYPNPTSDVVYLIFKTADLHIVSITNKSGKVLFNQSFDVQVQTIAIDVSDFSTGEYRVTVDNGKQKSTLCLTKVDRN